jgi:hypothetical protein
MQLLGVVGLGGEQINQLQLGNAPMRTNVTVIASAVLLTLSLGVAHAADTNAPSANQPSGAAVGTPGTENKGNPVPVPDQDTGGTVDKSGNPSATTPAEENKGKPTIPE